eukprot:TRINITY_DN172_c0_g2_i1.p1 TRINITY_DN172_c0_g2~~TRINITY_DN172_c0_g2_i1.p1  ORF type:complete len:208 (-),score=27.98 TRINITY_DN172_c0_g2_i1:776-1399(-)
MSALNADVRRAYATQGVARMAHNAPLNGSGCAATRAANTLLSHSLAQRFVIAHAAEAPQRTQLVSLCFSPSSARCEMPVVRTSADKPLRREFQLRIGELPTERKSCADGAHDWCVRLQAVGFDTCVHTVWLLACDGPDAYQLESLADDVCALSAPGSMLLLRVCRRYHTWLTEIHRVFGAARFVLMDEDYGQADDGWLFVAACKIGL